MVYFLCLSFSSCFLSLLTPFVRMYMSYILYSVSSSVFNYVCLYKNPASDQSCDVVKINNTECHSSGSKDWWTISARRILWTCWHLVFSLSPFSLTLCSHTQWRPFLPGLKYEVIDSAYISLYTGKSNSSNLCHLVVESNNFMINFLYLLAFTHWTLLIENLLKMLSWELAKRKGSIMP